jgi:hypothetical protein
VYVGGLLQSRSGDRQRGADAPQPAKLAVPDQGLTADVHLSSVLNSVADELFQRGEVQSVSNLMIVTRDAPPGSPPQQAATITRDVGFPAYASAVDEAVKAKNPQVTAIRLKRPTQAPEFAADAHGFLVVFLRDIDLEVPAPDKSTRVGSVIGVPAKILRIKIPKLELAFSYQVEQPAPGSHQVRAKIEDYSPSPNSQVLALNDDESKASPLTRFSGALVISALGARLRTVPILAKLDHLNLRGFTIQSVSPLDPSGWLRLTLARAPTEVPIPTAVAPDGGITYQAQNYPAGLGTVQPPGTPAPASAASVAAAR